MPRPSDPTVPAVLPLASFEILLTLAAGEQHGYGIKHAVEGRSNGAVSLGAGTLYAALQRLQDQGLIAEQAERPDPELGSSRWRFYAITAEGREILAREVERLEHTMRYARSLDLQPEGDTH